MSNRAVESIIDFDSGVRVIIALCCSHVEHSYARSLIAGQKLQAGGSSVTYVCLFLRQCSEKHDFGCETTTTGCAVKIYPSKKLFY